MKIDYRNLNSENEVTGTCHYLEVKFNDNPQNNVNFIVDFGIVQDSTKTFSQLYEINSRKHNIDYSNVNFAVLTHSHVDHVGRVSRLLGYGFCGSIITTSLSSAYTNLIMENECSLHNKEIIKYNNPKKNKKFKYTPLVTERMVSLTKDEIRGYSYYQDITINDNIKLCLIPNGHIGGSSFVLITLKDGFNIRKLFFTGDTSCFREIPFTKKPIIEKDLNINYIFTESTYGDRKFTECDIEHEMEKYIVNTCKIKNKSILIPTFSVGRSLSVLYYLKKIFDKNKNFENVSIVACSPMLCKAVRIGLNPEYKDYYDEKWNQSELSEWDKVEYIEHFQDLVNRMADKKPTIYVASSGMLGEGGYSSYIMQRFLPKKDYRIILVGYQSVGSIGNQLMNGIQKTVTIEEDGRTIKLPVKASISKIDGFSSHADYKQLIELFKMFKENKINKIIVTHGQCDSKDNFSKELKREFNTSTIIVPEYNKLINIM